MYFLLLHVLLVVALGLSQLIVMRQMRVINKLRNTVLQQAHCQREELVSNEWYTCYSAKCERRQSSPTENSLV